MKKLITMTILLSLSMAVQAQVTSKIIGKWNIFEMQMEGSLFGLDELKKHGKDTDYFDIQKDGKLVSFDDGIEHLGTWTFLDAAGMKIEMVLHPTEDEKTRGAGDAKMTYDVAELSDEHLVLNLGTFSSTKYTRAKE